MTGAVRLRRLAGAALLALACGGPSAAAERLPLPLHYDPQIAWFDVPWITPHGEGRVRIVAHGREVAAALTVDQFYTYRLAYRRALGALALHMPVHQAEPRARHRAFLAVLHAYPRFEAGGYALHPVDPLRLFDPRVLPRHPAGRR